MGLIPRDVPGASIDSDDGTSGAGWVISVTHDLPGERNKMLVLCGCVPGRRSPQITGGDPLFPISYLIIR